MIKRILFTSRPCFNPYDNLAFEKYLLDHVQDGEVILYLWQNERTVVCGRNQNLWKECHVSRLLSDGGYPARRLSGGGSVFHDLGNLNFTFLAKKAVYNVECQLQVILEACQELGIDAQKNGRNDLTIDGRKFSGNAFYVSANRAYHHGTLLIHADTERMSAYLNVDKEKLASKGVRSVRSRVANLIDFCPGLTPAQMELAMRHAFEKVYGMTADFYDPATADLKELEENRKFFCSDQWLYGRRMAFSLQINRRFSWGDFDLHLNVHNGLITDSILYSDALDEAFICRIQNGLSHLEFSISALNKMIRSCCQTEQHQKMSEDILRLLYDFI